MCSPLSATRMDYWVLPLSSGCNKNDRLTWVFPLHGERSLSTKPEAFSDLTPSLQLRAAQPILKTISSPKLLGHCPHEWGTQYTQTFGLSRVSTSNELGASASVLPLILQLVGWAHYIHLCRLYMVGRSYALLHFRLMELGWHNNIIRVRTVVPLVAHYRLKGRTTSTPAHIPSGKEQ